MNHTIHLHPNDDKPETRTLHEQLVSLRLSEDISILARPDQLDYMLRLRDAAGDAAERLARMGADHE